MNVEVIDSKKAYKAPCVKVVDVNVDGVICQRSDYETNRQDWEYGGDI